MAQADIDFATLEPGGGERFQALRRELGVSTFGINLITLEPRQRGRVHAHARQEEVYLVLEGRLTLLLENAEYALEPNQLVRVGPAVRRQLVNHGPERLVLLALGGSNEHDGRDGRAWGSFTEPGEGRAPQEVSLPDDLPGG